MPTPSMKYLPWSFWSSYHGGNVIHHRRRDPPFSRLVASWMSSSLWRADARKLCLNPSACGPLRERRRRPDRPRQTSGVYVGIASGRQTDSQALERLGCRPVAVAVRVVGVAVIMAVIVILPAVSVPRGARGRRGRGARTGRARSTPRRASSP